MARSDIAMSRGDAQKSGHAHLHVDDTIGTLLNHPTFAGCGRLILPWAGRQYDETMRLDQIGALLPYHSHVDADTIVASLNRMIDDASTGRTVFYPIYAEAQRQTNPMLESTGLFYFRGTPGAPFAVIAPGGGFTYVASVHEGFPYAVRISDPRVQRVCPGHGFGIGVGTSAEGWTVDGVRFWTKQINETAHRKSTPRL